MPVAALGEDYVRTARAKGVVERKVVTAHALRNALIPTVTVLGLTFKENVPDLRNSRAFDLIRRLKELGHEVEVADPFADPDEVAREHRLTLSRPNGASYDLVIGAVAHDQYRGLDNQELAALVAPGGTLADLKGMWRERELDGIDRWSL